MREGEESFHSFVTHRLASGDSAPHSNEKKAENIMIYKYETAWKERRRLEESPGGVAAES